MLTEVTVFVYSAGKLAAEYSTAPPEQNPTTKWTVTDQLGSPRVLVDSLGQVVSRRDFMPFGEEIFPDGVHRTTNLKYTYADDVRQKFTGYLKDEETGLDFAEARMYENRHARFTAVDPLLASGKNANPQTFNRYVYVLNNPLIFTDPTGLQTNSVVRGRVFYNPAEDTYQIGKCDGYVRVTGPPIESDRSDGNRYRIASNYWRILGRTADFVNESTRANISGQLPQDIEYRANQEVASAATRVSNAVGYVAPDYVKLNASIPIVFNVEFTVTRDLNTFYGGGTFQGPGEWKNFISQAKDFNFLEGKRNLGFKLGAGASLGWFTKRNMPSEERSSAVGGTNVNAVIPLAPIAPISAGLSQSIPNDGSSILTAPRAIEVGTPTNAGVGVSTSRQFYDFGAWFTRQMQERDRAIRQR